METTQCLIIGSGPAGYTAGIYLARAGVEHMLVEGALAGGQLTQTTTIENFPGFAEGISGFELMEAMRNQAKRLGTPMQSAIIKSIDLSNRPFVATLDTGDTIAADTVIVATGASPKYLGLDDERKYAGMGVSACATCDGFFYRKKTVAVVGGGDTACEEAQYLSSLCAKVYMIVRKDHLRATEAMQQRIAERENIEVLYNTNAVGLYGNNGVEGAHLVRFMGTDREERFDLPIDGFFLAIGHTPNTSFLNGQLELDASGYIITQAPTTATNVPGVFAAGDVADPRYRQAITAAASGARAAIDVKDFLQ